MNWSQGAFCTVTTCPLAPPGDFPHVITHPFHHDRASFTSALIFVTLKYHVPFVHSLGEGWNILRLRLFPVVIRSFQPDGRRLDLPPTLRIHLQMFHTDEGERALVRGKYWECCSNCLKHGEQHCYHTVTIHNNSSSKAI